MDGQDEIWRPNGFTPEEWRRLTRDQQARWWKDQESKEPVGREPLRAIDLYREGAIAKGETPSAVFRRLTEKNVREFLTHCAPDLLLLVREHAASLPADDDEERWGEVVHIFGGEYDPWVTVEEIRETEEEAQHRFREGLRVFRAHARDNLDAECP